MESEKILSYETKCRRCGQIEEWYFGSTNETQLNPKKYMDNPKDIHDRTFSQAVGRWAATLGHGPALKELLLLKEKYKWLKLDKATACLAQLERDLPEVIALCERTENLLNMYRILEQAGKLIQKVDPNEWEWKTYEIRGRKLSFLKEKNGRKMMYMNTLIKQHAEGGANV